jgi:50S ribosomal subunit-associated GTPase HflX
MKKRKRKTSTIERNQMSGFTNISKSELIQLLHIVAETIKLICIIVRL